MIYQYTNINALALILKNRTIRFNRLDRVDDIEQQLYELGYEYSLEDSWDTELTYSILPVNYVNGLVASTKTCKASEDFDDEDFDVMYTKEEIYEFIKENGIELPEEEYNVIYDTGLKNYPNDEGKMSVNQFIYTMRNFKREYNRKRVALMQ